MNQRLTVQVSTALAFGPTGIIWAFLPIQLRSLNASYLLIALISLIPAIETIGLSCLGRHSRQDGQRKQDPSNFSTSARSRILGLPIPGEPARVCSCRIFDGALLL